MRLYRQGNFKRAANLLPGVGDKIKSIDVS